MKMTYRVPVLVLALPLCVLLSGYSNAQSQAALWSDPATWPDNKVPAAGEQITIASGKDVILDVSPPTLGGITISGKLTFADNADLELSTEWIMLHGELQIGTEAKPHTHKATITLTNNVPDEQMMGMGDRGIMLSGGTLNLHGDRSNSWTKLSKTAEAGSTSIDVLNAAQWKAGDEIVLASTDFEPRQAERRTITAISGNTLTLDKPLDYMHFGEITFGVDERGEVGMLTRNIKVQASEDAAQTFFGGHIMAMVTSKMYVEGVELNRMGQNLELARYPIHWHLVGDTGQGQYIRNAAIHDTFNRCVTVHGTNFLRVENNVTYNTVGHCFFMEDGIEHHNEFVHNLAIQTKCHTSKACVPTNLAAAGERPDYQNRQAVRENGQNATDVLLPSDNTVSSYWITNPDNTYRDNVAAGSDANGFWMALPEHPNGAFQDSDASKATWPRRTPLREFKGNVAHSNYDSFMFDRNIAANNTFGVTGSSHTGLENPADPASKPVVALFEDPLFVGETDNIGNPQTAEEKAYGRSLPKPALPDFPIRGYEYYDYRHDIINTTFVNYADNAVRKTGAISNLLFSSFGVSTNNAFERVKFENAKPIYFPPMEGNAKWANDNGSGASYKTAAYRDRDGSLGFGPNSFVIIHDGVNDSVATDVEACQIKSDWNAAVCKGDVGRLSFAAPGGGFGRGPGAAPAAGAQRPAGAGPGGPGGAFGAPPPAQPPVVLSRSGQDYTVTGASNVRAGTTIKATTERPTMNLTLTELDKGSWVIFELPQFTTAAAGVQQNSLDALRNASETSYFKGTDALWVKIVSTGDSGTGAPGGGTSVPISR